MKSIVSTRFCHFWTYVLMALVFFQLVEFTHSQVSNNCNANIPYPLCGCFLDSIIDALCDRCTLQFSQIYINLQLTCCYRGCNIAQIQAACESSVNDIDIPITRCDDIYDTAVNAVCSGSNFGANTGFGDTSAVNPLSYYSSAANNFQNTGLSSLSSPVVNSFQSTGVSPVFSPTFGSLQSAGLSSVSNYNSMNAGVMNSLLGSNFYSGVGNGFNPGSIDIKNKCCSRLGCTRRQIRQAVCPLAPCPPPFTSG